MGLCGVKAPLSLAMHREKEKQAEGSSLSTCPLATPPCPGESGTGTEEATGPSALELVQNLHYTH